MERVLDLCDRKEGDFQASLILEHLIYYMDWVQDVAGSGPLPVELWAMIRSMGQHGFIRRVWTRCSCGNPVRMRFFRCRQIEL